MKRKRLFPHVDGELPSYICIPFSFEITTSKKFVNILKISEKNIKSEKIEVVENFHISLSKVFTLTSNEKQEMKQDLIKILKEIDEFCISIEVSRKSIINLQNDSKTVTFSVAKLDFGNKSIIHLVNEIDKILSNYNKALYYKPPIPHISLHSFDSNENIKKTLVSYSSSDSDSQTSTLHTDNQPIEYITLIVKDISYIVAGIETKLKLKPF